MKPPCSVADCPTPARARGMCSSHWNKWRRYGSPTNAPVHDRIAEARERAEQKIRKGTGCWEWTGTLDGYGYGVITVEGQRTKAHRFMYQQTIGPIPAGLVIDHLCCNTACVNPAHMEPVTHLENTRRGSSRHGERQTACRAKGHDWSNPNNIRTRKNGNRYCAECDRAASRARRRNNKETA